MTQVAPLLFNEKKKSFLLTVSTVTPSSFRPKLQKARKKEYAVHTKLLCLTRAISLFILLSSDFAMPIITEGRYGLFCVLCYLPECCPFLAAFSPRSFAHGNPYFLSFPSEGMSEMSMQCFCCILPQLPMLNDANTLHNSQYD